MADPSANSRYVVKSIVHASQVLSAFRSEDEVLRLRDVVSRSGLNKVMCFRLLYTLHLCGFLEKVGESQYRLMSRVKPSRRSRIGFATQGHHTSFAREVEASVVRAAEAAHLQLVLLDNRGDTAVSIRNAEQFVRDEVDLAVEFQMDESAAPAIAARFFEADIPLISVDAPHAGASYFGANYYEAGLIGGRYLGKWANRYWNGACEEVVVVDHADGGSAPQTRFRGVLAGIEEMLSRTRRWKLVHLNGDGQLRTSLECVRKHLRTSRSRHALIDASSDASAIGALRAYQEAGAAANCAIVGHNAGPEGRAELRQPRTKLIGSVAYFPENYGEGILRLALDLLGKKPAPPAVFTRHRLLTPENVDQFYPNDTRARVP